MGVEKEASGVRVGRDALQKRKGVATTVRDSGSEARGREERIYRNNFLQQGRNGPERMPQDWRKVGKI